MDLKSYLAILRRRTDVIAITLALAVLMASLGTYLIEPRYRASTSLRLTTVIQGSADWIDYDLDYADRLMNTYSKIAASMSTKMQVMRDLNLTEVPEISTEILANTELMKITADAREPELAAQIANRVAEILIREGGESASEMAQNTQKILASALENSKGELDDARQAHEQTRALYAEGDAAITAAKQTLDLKQKIYEKLIEQQQQSQIREALQTQMLTVLDTALAPKDPYKPNPQMNLALGLLFGLIGGLGLAFLFENLTSTPTHSGVVGQLTDARPTAALPLVSLDAPAATIQLNPADAVFERLYQTIWGGNQASRRKKILILGVEAGEEKTNTAFKLACRVAQTGQQVVLVDADFQVPTLHQLFSLPNQYGLSNLLNQSSKLKDVTWINKTYGIHLITSGTAPHHSAGLLNSPQMDQALSRLAAQFDVVLLSGPALDTVETTALATRSDGLVIVADDGQKWQEREAAVQMQFAQLGVPVLAIIHRQTSTTVQEQVDKNYIPEYHPNGSQRLFRLT